MYVACMPQLAYCIHEIIKRHNCHSRYVNPPSLTFCASSSLAFNCQYKFLLSIGLNLEVYACVESYLFHKCKYTKRFANMQMVGHA